MSLRPRDSRRRTALAVLVLTLAAGGLAGARPAAAVPLALRVDPARSWIGLLPGAQVTVDLDPAGPGQTVPLGPGTGTGSLLPDGTLSDGLRAPLAGDLLVDVTASTVEFDLSSVVRSLPSGSWQPATSATPTAGSPASLGLHFDAGAVSGDIAIRNLLFQVASGPTPYVETAPGSFALTMAPFPFFLGGEAALALSTGLSAGGAFLAFPNLDAGLPTLSGTLGSDADGSFTLTLDYAFPAAHYNAADLSLPAPLSMDFGIEARIVAQPVSVPEPSRGLLWALTGLGLLRAGRPAPRRRRPAGRSPGRVALVLLLALPLLGGDCDGEEDDDGSTAQAVNVAIDTTVVDLQRIRGYAAATVSEVTEPLPTAPTVLELTDGLDAFRGELSFEQSAFPPLGAVYRHLASFDGDAMTELTTDVSLTLGINQAGIRTVPMRLDVPDLGLQGSFSYTATVQCDDQPSSSLTLNAPGSAILDAQVNPTPSFPAFAAVCELLLESMVSTTNATPTEWYSASINVFPQVLDGCLINGNCADPNGFCNAAGTCGAGGTGQPCQVDDQCAGPNQCIQAVCQPPLAAGAFCRGFDAECESGLVCALNRCTSPPPCRPQDPPSAFDLKCAYLPTPFPGGLQEFSVGAGQAGAPCPFPAGGGDGCDRGLQCDFLPGGSLTCQPFCWGDADCATGSYCDPDLDYVDELPEGSAGVCRVGDGGALGLLPIF